MHWRQRKAAWRWNSGDGVLHLESLMDVAVRSCLLDIKTRIISCGQRRHSNQGSTTNSDPADCNIRNKTQAKAQHIRMMECPQPMEVDQPEVKRKEKARFEEDVVIHDIKDASKKYDVEKHPCSLPIKPFVKESMSVCYVIHQWLVKMCDADFKRLLDLVSKDESLRHLFDCIGSQFEMTGPELMQTIGKAREAKPPDAWSAQFCCLSDMTYISALATRSRLFTLFDIPQTGTLGGHAGNGKSGSANGPMDMRCKKIKDHHKSMIAKYKRDLRDAEQAKVREKRMTNLGKNKNNKNARSGNKKSKGKNKYKAMMDSSTNPTDNRYHHSTSYNRANTNSQFVHSSRDTGEGWKDVKAKSNNQKKRNSKKAKQGENSKWDTAGEDLIANCGSGSAKYAGKMDPPSSKRTSGSGRVVQSSPSSPVSNAWSNGPPTHTNPSEHTSPKPETTKDTGGHAMTVLKSERPPPTQDLRMVQLYSYQQGVCRMPQKSGQNAYGYSGFGSPNRSTVLTDNSSVVNTEKRSTAQTSHGTVPQKNGCLPTLFSKPSENEQPDGAHDEEKGMIA